MNPDHFQNTVLAWIAAATIVLPVATGFIVKLLGAVTQVKGTIDDLRVRQEAQSKHLISQQQQITTIALATQSSTTPANANPPTNTTP